jgi:signal transduction histidine kinase
MEAGVFTPRQEVFAIAPLIERTWAALRADRPFDFSTSGAPHLAIGDPDRLEQVLWAVLDNAVKYSPAASAVEVRVQPEGESLAITVRDHGAGMDEDTSKRAFEQFFRSADARRLAPDGSGVGLYAARGLMDAMGGSITAGAALGIGTTITIRIPAEPSAPSAE